MVMYDNQKLVGMKIPPNFMDKYSPGCNEVVARPFERPSVLEFVASAQANLGVRMEGSVATALTVSELFELFCCLTTQERFKLDVPRELRRTARDLGETASSVEVFIYDVLHKCGLTREQVSTLLLSDRQALSAVYGKVILPQTDINPSDIAKRQSHLVFDAYQEGFPRPAILTGAELQEAIYQINCIACGREPVPSNTHAAYFSPENLRTRIKEYDAEHTKRNSALGHEPAGRIMRYNNRVLHERQKLRAAREHALAKLSA
jgi:hypothetical protein